jgi:hypothetical protein
MMSMKLNITPIWLCSISIESKYTNIPIQELIDRISNILTPINDSQTKTTFNFMMSNTYKLKD